LRGAIFWVSVAAAFLINATDRTRFAIYAKTMAIIGGASCAAGYGLQNYLLHVRNGEPQWREFGTSLPDFFAGHLVMTAPTALALFIGSKGGKGRIFWLLYLLALVVQLAAIPTTGSRFALASLPIGLAVVLFLVALAKSHGMEFGPQPKRRLTALVVIALLGGVIVARPVLMRLSSATVKSQAHSGDFRAWTWLGTVNLIKASPILGAGPGMFANAYPQHAIVGFTTHAHDAYLQTAGDIGVPALAVLLLAFGLCVRSGLQALSWNSSRPTPTGPPKGRKQTKAKVQPSDNEVEDQIFLCDDRYLICGLIGSVVAACVQNIVDSDWFTFASGVTLLSLLGLICSLSPIVQLKKPTNWISPATIGAMTVVALLAAYVAVAQSEDSTGHYQAAAQMYPLSGAFQDDLGMHVYAPAANSQDTEAALIRSCRLSPTAVEYHKLGTLYLDENEYDKAIANWQTGLQYDPHSILLLGSLASLETELGHSTDAFGYYRTIVALESTPYGTVRAIPEVTETKFADADVAVGDHYLAARMPAKSIPYYLSAKSDCELYASLGGASNGMRMAMHQGVPDTDLDSHMQSLYSRVLENLNLAYSESGNTAAAAELGKRIDDDLKTFSEQIAPIKG
jgi:tetratricopeptide (TPR) repeat protein